MTGLVLKLRPFEKLLVNGAVLQNGPRATRLRVRTAGASILRLRDALHPCEVETRAGRIYYLAQLAVAGEAEAGGVAAELAQLIDEGISSAADDSERTTLLRAKVAAAAGRLYSVMRAVRPLLSGPGKPAPEAA